MHQKNLKTGKIIKWQLNIYSNIMKSVKKAFIGNLMLLVWQSPMKNMHIKHVKEHFWKEATWHDKKISKSHSKMN